jgi:hypothetical protein
MRTLDFYRYAFGICATLAMLAGCGGSQNSMISQGLPSASQRVHRASGSNSELVYVVTSRAVIMVSYPQGQIVGSIPWYFANGILCSDPNNGNVFLPEGGTIYEYAHGGTSPFATLSIPTGYSPAGGCSVDPTTDNLALVTQTIKNGNSWGAVLVYPGAQGSPTIYISNKLAIFKYPAYDNAGNLFVTSDTKKSNFRFGEIQAGQNQFTLIKLNANVGFPNKIQWDGTYLTFEYDSGKRGSGSEPRKLGHG